MTKRIENQETPTKSTKSPPKTSEKTLEFYLKKYNASFSRPLDEVWAEIDTNGKGQLTKDQTKQFMAQVVTLIDQDRMNNYDPSKFESMFDEFDDDKNGFMSKSEIAQFIKIAFKSTKKEKWLKILDYGE